VTLKKGFLEAENHQKRLKSHNFVKSGQKEAVLTVLADWRLPPPSLAIFVHANGRDPVQADTNHFLIN